MAKVKKTYAFKNGVISKEDNRYILTEISKDNAEVFDLSFLLDGMIGIEGISLNFGSEDSVPTIS